MKKISLEDHFMLPQYSADGPNSFTKSVQADYAKMMVNLLGDFDCRLQKMNNAGIDKVVLSLTQPGIQAEVNVERAIAGATLMNDLLAEKIANYPKRFYGFAALPMQDPVVAAKELERVVKNYHFVGACINGYSNLGDEKTGLYLDEEINLVFWQKVEELGVPVYLHPRIALPSQQRIYQGYPALLGSAWGFAHETATHCLRLIMSGLFDKFPNLKIIIGHMGEGIPCMLDRIDKRLSYQPLSTRGNQKLKILDYFMKNFFITTSGISRTQSLINAMLEIGADRILFSSDYPYESMEEAANWMDSCPISEADRYKISFQNAQLILNI